jgi:hypothetical protein
VNVGKAWIAPDRAEPENLHLQEARRVAYHDLSGRVIQVGPADRSYNCHGWIFTGGRYLLPDFEVDLVLRDNGYLPVTEPQVGDLAVYHDENGNPWHSARVWGVGEDGRVLLESKWAWMGRFLHPPEATPYGQNWTYYHSPRPGHLLRGLRDQRPEAPHASTLSRTGSPAREAVRGTPAALRLLPAVTAGRVAPD